MSLLVLPAYQLYTPLESDIYRFDIDQYKTPIQVLTIISFITSFSCILISFLHSQHLKKFSAAPQTQQMKLATLVAATDIILSVSQLLMVDNSIMWGYSLTGLSVHLWLTQAATVAFVFYLLAMNLQILLTSICAKPSLSRLLQPWYEFGAACLALLLTHPVFYLYSPLQWSEPDRSFVSDDIYSVQKLRGYSWVTLWLWIVAGLVCCLCSTVFITIRLYQHPTRFGTSQGCRSKPIFSEIDSTTRYNRMLSTYFESVVDWHRHFNLQKPRFGSPYNIGYGKMNEKWTPTPTLSSSSNANIFSGTNRSHVYPFYSLSSVSSEITLTPLENNDRPTSSTAKSIPLSRPVSSNSSQIILSSRLEKSTLLKPLYDPVAAFIVRNYCMPTNVSPPSSTFARLRRSHQNHQANKLSYDKYTIHRLWIQLLYPLALQVLALQVAMSERPIYVIRLLVIFLSSLQGIFNSIMFIANPLLKPYWVHLGYRWRIHFLQRLSLPSPIVTFSRPQSNYTQMESSFWTTTTKSCDSLGIDSGVPITKKDPSSLTSIFSSLSKANTDIPDHQKLATSYPMKQQTIAYHTQEEPDTDVNAIKVPTLQRLVNGKQYTRVIPSTADTVAEAIKENDAANKVYANPLRCTLPTLPELCHINQPMYLPKGSTEIATWVKMPVSKQLRSVKSIQTPSSQKQTNQYKNDDLLPRDLINLRGSSHNIKSPSQLRIYLQHEQSEDARTPLSSVVLVPYEQSERSTQLASTIRKLEGIKDRNISAPESHAFPY